MVRFVLTADVRVALEFLADGILRVRMTRRGGRTINGQSSGAVVYRGDSRPLVNLRDDGKILRLATSEIEVVVTYQPLRIDNQG